MNNKDFPVPKPRKNFNSTELQKRRMQGRNTPVELQRSAYHNHTDLTNAKDIQNTGREGLSGPSQLGVFPRGQAPLAKTLGGGYYFVPPIPKKKISEIGEQFFT